MSAAPRPARLQPRPLRGAAGFTLIEMLVVVIIITVLAVIAVPSIQNRMRETRSREATAQVATIYRNARMRAMGRGAATLVRFTSSSAPRGRIEVREALKSAQETATAGCAVLPSQSCSLPTWIDAGAGVPADNQRLEYFDPSESPAYKGLYLQLRGYQGGSLAQTTYADVCYTPLGRTFVRYSAAATFQPLTSVLQADVFRSTNGSARDIGLPRFVLVLPSGASRVAEGQ